MRQKLFEPCSNHVLDVCHLTCRNFRNDNSQSWKRRNKHNRRNEMGCRGALKYMLNVESQTEMEGSDLCDV